MRKLTPPAPAQGEVWTIEDNRSGFGLGVVVRSPLYGPCVVPLVFGSDPLGQEGFLPVEIQRPHEDGSRQPAFADLYFFAPAAEWRLTKNTRRQLVPPSIESLVEQLDTLHTTYASV